jgi:hypothetical protein
MLAKHGSRVCTFFAVDFEPRFGVELSNAAGLVYEEYRPPHYKAALPLAFVLSWPNTRKVLSITHNRVAWQTLGLSTWSDGWKEHMATIRTALKSMHVSAFKRIGFKTVAYLPLSMSHAEMCELMFGAFLAPEEDFAQVHEGARDPLLQIEGESRGLKYILVVTPFDKKQASRNFLSLPNLELFLENKYLDQGVKDFHDRVTESDCFLVDIDLFRVDVEADCLEDFLKASLATAEQVTTSCVRRLRSQPEESERIAWRSSS